MNAQDRIKLRHLARRLKAVLDELDSLAQEVERNVFKKTTQDSPEWHGRANRRVPYPRPIIFTYHSRLTRGAT